MKSLVAALLLTLPLPALAAAPPTPPTPPTPPSAPELSREARDRMDRMERTSRVVGLAEELDLTTAEALRVDEVMRKYDEKRKQLKEQVAEAAKLLERAADGDAEAGKQVDQASQRIFEARTQIASIDREMFQAIAKDMKPQQKARMAVYFARQENANIERRVIIRKNLGDVDRQVQERMKDVDRRLQLRLKTVRPGGGGDRELEREEHRDLQRELERDDD